MSSKTSTDRIRHPVFLLIVASRLFGCVNTLAPQRPAQLQHRTSLSFSRLPDAKKYHFAEFSCRKRRRQLTTKVNGDDDSARLSLKGHFQQAGNKFKARPGTYLLIPCVAALVGWFTNWLAVQMIFYPVKFRGIPLYIREEIPLGLLGWQGIVPCKTRPMSETMVNMVTSQLLTVKEAFGRLDPSELAKRLAPEVPKMGESVLSDVLPRNWMVGMPRAAFLGLPEASQRILEYFNFRFLKGLATEMITNIDSYFNIQNCVQSQMMMDRSLLGELFKKCGQKELDFLTNSGLWFGFLLGLIQMAVTLFYDNPWTLSIGGMIVGLATNWLALKWIFEPVNPTKFGPFILQGQFLRRQKEVAAEFSNFFANNILSSEQVWRSILTDPTTSPSFYALFARHFMSFANRIKSCLRINVEPEVIQMATSRAMAKLPDHVHVLHSYIDRTLGLQGTLRVKMEQMTSSQFERVLHPIFEEDELTLILAGAALGFAAGFIQQLIETGKIKIPNFWSPIGNRISPYLEYPVSQIRVFCSKAKKNLKKLFSRFGLSSWKAPNGSSRNDGSNINRLPEDNASSDAASKEGDDEKSSLKRTEDECDENADSDEKI